MHAERVEQGSTPQRPRARGHVWILVVAGLLVVAVGTAGWFLANYQPILPGNIEGAHLIESGMSLIGQGPSPSGSPSAGAGELRLPYRQGAPAVIEFELRNDGPVDVSITGFDPGTGHDLYTVVGVRLGSAGDASLAATVPFEPFLLRAHEYRTVFLVVRLEGCRTYGPGTGMTLVQEHVRFELLGVTRWTWVPLLHGIRISAPSHCSEPTG